MATKHMERSDTVLKPLDGLLPDLEKLYKDIHAHPELSMQETRTANIAAERLRAAGFDVTTGIGKNGVVGLLRNGGGAAAANDCLARGRADRCRRGDGRLASGWHQRERHPR